MSNISRPDADAIDVSHWNIIEDWDAIPHFDLWCLKATEGRGFVSPVFHERWAETRARGVKYRGAYHWIRSDSPMEAQVQNLSDVLDAHGGLQQGEFVMLDWETTPGIKDVTVADVERWLELAEARWPGRIIVYCSDWVPGFKTWRRQNSTYPLWYANYRLVRDDRGGEAESDQWGAAVWQWTSTELVPGYRNGIDMNDVLDWDVISRISGYSEPTEPPAAKPIEYAPPEHWGLYPVDVDKPDLRRTRDAVPELRGHVHYLQSVLRHELNYRIVVDGWFGPETERHVMLFQKANHVTIDGWVGRKETWPLIDALVL